jgi:hypothetical protein
LTAAGRIALKTLETEAKTPGNGAPCARWIAARSKKRVKNDGEGGDMILRIQSP